MRHQILCRSVSQTKEFWKPSTVVWKAAEHQSGPLFAPPLELGITPAERTLDRQGRKARRHLLSRCEEGIQTPQSLACASENRMSLPVKKWYDIGQVIGLHWNDKRMCVIRNCVSEEMRRIVYDHVIKSGLHRLLYVGLRGCKSLGEQVE